MLNERYQVSAIAISTGDMVTGYLSYDGIGDAVIESVNSLGVWERRYKIDPSTIEPVMAKPIRVKWEFAWKEGQYRHFCPSCESDCAVVNDESKLEYCLEHFGQPDYCPWCGQALDWKDKKQ